MKHFLIIFMWFVFGAILNWSLPDNKSNESLADQPTTAADVMAVVGTMSERSPTAGDPGQEAADTVNCDSDGHVGLQLEDGLHGPQMGPGRRRLFCEGLSDAPATSRAPATRAPEEGI